MWKVWPGALFWVFLQFLKDRKFASDHIAWTFSSSTEIVLRDCCMAFVICACYRSHPSTAPLWVISVSIDTGAWDAWGASDYRKSLMSRICMVSSFLQYSQEPMWKRSLVYLFSLVYFILVPLHFHLEGLSKKYSKRIYIYWIYIYHEPERSTLWPCA